jgi:hypothetical protein
MTIGGSQTFLAHTTFPKCWQLRRERRLFILQSWKEGPFSSVEKMAGLPEERITRAGLADSAADVSS